MMPLKPTLPILLCLLLVGPMALVAQGAYLDRGVNGFGAELRAEWNPNGFEGLGLLSGFSIGGLLDFGLDLTLSLSEVEGRAAGDFGMGFTFNVNVLKQAGGSPVSLQLQGSYGAVTVISPYLQDLGGQRWGQEVTIGVVLSRDIRISASTMLRLSALSDYQSASYTTTWADGTPDSTDYRREVYAGGAVGLLFRFAEGTVLALQGELRSDENFELQIRPVVAISIPTR